MKKTILICTSVLSMFLVCAFTYQHSNWEDCDGCEYEKTYKREINGGDDKVYNLYCRKSGNDYTIYKRKNGKWERQGEDKQYDECDLVKFMCDCAK
jgi:hypothetical protein